MLGELSNSFLICLPSISPGLEFFTGSENDPFLSIEIWKVENLILYYTI